MNHILSLLVIWGTLHYASGFVFPCNNDGKPYHTLLHTKGYASLSNLNTAEGFARHIVVYRAVEADTGVECIKGSIVDSNGKPLMEVMELFCTSSSTAHHVRNPSAAYSAASDMFAVAWEIDTNGTTGIMIAAISAQSGEPVSAPKQLKLAGISQERPTLAYSIKNNFFVLAFDTAWPDRCSSVDVEILQDDLSLVRGWQLGSHTAANKNPAVGYSIKDGTFIVAWEQMHCNSTGRSTVEVQALDLDGEPKNGTYKPFYSLGPTANSNSDLRNKVHNVRITYGHGTNRFYVSWEYDEKNTTVIHVHTVQPTSANPIFKTIPLSTVAGTNATNARAAFANTSREVVIVWESKSKVATRIVATTLGFYDDGPYDILLQNKSFLLTEDIQGLSPVIAWGANTSTLFVAWASVPQSKQPGLINTSKWCAIVPQAQNSSDGAASTTGIFAGIAVATVLVVLIGGGVCIFAAAMAIMRKRSLNIERVRGHSSMQLQDVR